MNKRIMNLLVAGAVLLLASSVSAQVNTEDKIELTRTYIEANRQTIVVSAMELTEEESKVFWPVYQDYRTDIETVNDRSIKILRDYADNFENLSDAMAAEMMSEYLDIEEDRLIYKQIYVELLTEALPISKVVRFFQLENKMDAVIKFDLAAEVPFAAIKEAPEAEVAQ
jgi:hypothetical protein